MVHIPWQEEENKNFFKIRKDCLKYILFIVVEELDMSTGKYTAMSFRFNSFANLPISMLQSSRGFYMQYLQLVFVLTL